MDQADSSSISIGSRVVALNGEALGKVHRVQPHFFVIEGEGPDGHAEYEVPIRAAVVEGGQVRLTVNREALTIIPSEHQAVAHRLGEE